MSEKPRAKIELRDIKSGCIRRNGNCEKDGFICEYRQICREIKNEMPFCWSLSDPPRFDEAQMALLEALWNMGARTGFQAEYEMIFYRQVERYEYIGQIDSRVLKIELKAGETLDLAELFGKEGAK